MKSALKIAVVATVLALSACGGGGGDDSKDLFSVWTRDGATATIDLSRGAFSTPALFFTIDPNGAQCNCVLTLVGTQDKGSLAINQCSFVRGSASKDPGCSQRGGVGSYTNIKALLTVTGPTGQVVTYR